MANNSIYRLTLTGPQVGAALNDVAEFINNNVSDANSIAKWMRENGGKITGIKTSNGEELVPDSEKKVTLPNYLLKSGGTMSGELGMGENAIKLGNYYGSVGYGVLQAHGYSVDLKGGSSGGLNLEGGNNQTLKLDGSGGITLQSHSSRNTTIDGTVVPKNADLASNKTNINIGTSTKIYEDQLHYLYIDQVVDSLTDFSYYKFPLNDGSTSTNRHTIATREWVETGDVKRYAKLVNTSQLVAGQSYHIHVPAHTTLKSTTLCLHFNSFSNLKTNISITQRDDGESSCFGISHGTTEYSFAFVGNDPSKVYNLNNANHDFDVDIVFSYDGSYDSNLVFTNLVNSGAIEIYAVSTLATQLDLTNYFPKTGGNIYGSVTIRNNPEGMPSGSLYVGEWSLYTSTSQGGPVNYFGNDCFNIYGSAYSGKHTISDGQSGHSIEFDHNNNRLTLISNYVGRSDSTKMHITDFGINVDVAGPITGFDMEHSTYLYDTSYYQFPTEANGSTSTNRHTLATREWAVGRDELKTINGTNLIKSRSSTPITQLSDLVVGHTYHIHVPAHTSFPHTSSLIRCSAFSNIKTNISQTIQATGPSYGSGIGYTAGDPTLYGFCTEVKKGYQLTNADYDFDCDFVFSGLMAYDGNTSTAAQYLPYIYECNDNIDIPVEKGSGENSIIQLGTRENTPNQATGTNAIALGGGNVVAGNYSTAIGTTNYAGDNTDFILGGNNWTKGRDQIIIGQSNIVSSESKGVAIGILNKVTHYGGVALGSLLTARYDQVAVGHGNNPDDFKYIATDDYYAPLFMVGNGTKQFNSVTKVSYNEAINGEYYTSNNELITPAMSPAEYNALIGIRQASGELSNAFVVYPNGDIKYSGQNLSDHLENVPDIGNGHNLQQTIDTPTFTVAAEYSTYKGQTVTAGSTGSKSSLSVNGSSSASGSRAFAANGKTWARGDRSFAINNSTTAEGTNSFAAGNMTTASGFAAAVFGEANLASHQGAFVVGTHNKSATEYQTVVGTFNSPSTSVFTVGNGTSESDRRNALDVYKDGHAEIQAMGTTNNSIATKEYVDTKCAQSLSLTPEQAQKLLALLDMISIEDLPNLVATASEE